MSHVSLVKGDKSLQLLSE